MRIVYGNSRERNRNISCNAAITNAIRHLRVADALYSLIKNHFQSLCDNYRRKKKEPSAPVTTSNLLFIRIAYGNSSKRNRNVLS